MRQAVTMVSLAFVLASVAPAHAQNTYSFDPSIRARGMGGAASAVSWDDDPGEWANPALLGYCDAIRFAHGEADSRVFVGSDARWRSDRITVGAYGVGLLLSGWPGGTTLRQGDAELEGGELHEDLSSMAIGVSVGRLLSSPLFRKDEDVPVLPRHLDLALGFGGKRLSNASTPLPEYTATTWDFGVLARAGATLPRGEDAILPVTVEGALGYGSFNFTKAKVDIVHEDSPAEMPRFSRPGLAARVALGLPGALRRALKGARLGWLAESLEPMASLGWAGDDEKVGPGTGWTVRHRGVEATFAGIFSLRHGRYADDLGGVVGTTDGIGIGFRIGRLAGFRYDRATVPWGARSLGWPDLTLTGWTVQADPPAILKALRR